MSKSQFKAESELVVTQTSYGFEMAGGHGHEREVPSETVWDAALACLRAGTSIPVVLAAMRLPEPERTRMQIKLKSMRRHTDTDDALSPQETLARLADLRRDELERPVVDAAEANAREIQDLLHSCVAIRNRREFLARQLRDIKRMLNDIERMGLGTPQKSILVARQYKTVAEILDGYESLLQLLDKMETVYVRATNQAGHGLLIGGASVKEAKNLGGFNRTERQVYRSREKFSDPPACEHRFTPTLRELIPSFHAAQAAIAELRASIASDQQRLQYSPGDADLA